MKVYVIRREDFFKAMTLGQIPENRLHHVGSLWIEISLTEEEKNNYSFPISPAY